MDQILQFLSSHYLPLCLCLLAVQIALLVAAFRTQKEVFWFASAAAPIISGVLTFHIPSNGQGYSMLETFLLFLIFDVIVLLICVGTRACSEKGGPLTVFWKVLWISMFLVFLALVAYVTYIAIT